MTLEREIYSIESANINKETLDAMKNAGKAMQSIHAGLTVDKVEDVMYVALLQTRSRSILRMQQRMMLTRTHRDGLRNQHEIGQEINEAITRGVGTEDVDEDELESELADLQQEQLDEKMLKTGTVPVGDNVGRLPTAAQHEVKGKARVEEDDEEEELKRLQAEMAM
jgi:charged multivesicular body protein 4